MSLIKYFTSSLQFTSWSVLILAAIGLSSLRNAAASESDQAENFRVVFLGTGTPVSGVQQFGASILVEAGGRAYVFDCGRGCGIRLQEVYGIGSFHRADTLFLTHLHSDHFVGIPEMYLNGWTQGREQPFRVFGPIRTTEMMGHLRQAFAPDIDFRRVEETMLGTPERMLGAEINAKNIQEGIVLEENGVTVTAFLVEHRHIKPAYGFRIDYRGRSVVISGDTAYSENLIKHAKNTDVLIHEVMSPALMRALHKRFDKQEQVDFIVSIHTPVADAVRVFNAVKPKLAVYYHTNNTAETSNELLQTTAEGYAGRTLVSYDLMQIDIEDDVRVSMVD